jgi:hypothetical protein
MAADTCNEYLSTTCLKWQGSKLSFYNTLQDKKSVEEIIKKLDDNITALSTLVNGDIDKKWMQGDFTTFIQYIQALIDEVGKLKQSVSNPIVDVRTINLDGTCISPSANKTIVGYDEAFVLIFQELCNINNKLNNTSNKIYLPNV